jgi:hypothetical protein
MDLYRSLVVSYRSFDLRVIGSEELLAVVDANVHLPSSVGVGPNDSLKARGLGLVSRVPFVASVLPLGANPEVSSRIVEPVAVDVVHRHPRWCVHDHSMEQDSLVLLRTDPLIPYCVSATVSPFAVAHLGKILVVDDGNEAPAQW